jgi:hypothetical protein
MVYLWAFLRRRSSDGPASTPISIIHLLMTETEEALADLLTRYRIVDG